MGKLVKNKRDLCLVTDDEIREETPLKGAKAMKGLGNERLARIFRIDRMLSETKKPMTVAAICERLEADKSFKSVTSRTVIDDLNFLLSLGNLNGFELSVDDSEKSFKYWIEEGHSLFRRDFTREQAHSLRELVNAIASYDALAELELVDNLNDVLERTEMGAKTRTIVDLGVSAFGNSELFHTLYHAIANRHVVKLEYRRMNELGMQGTVRSIMFQPCLIRQYAGRWTVIGADSSDGFICKFYFVQIVSAELTEKHYSETLDIRLKGHFKSVIGTSSPRSLCVFGAEKAVRESLSQSMEGERLEEIVVAAYPGWGNHLESFPLHGSQSELTATEAEQYRRRFAHLPEESRIFSFKVYVNTELESELMRWMDRVEVLAPASLRASLAERAARLADRYAAAARESLRGV